MGQAEEDTCNSQSYPLSPPLGQCTLDKTPEKKLLSHPGKDRDKEKVSRPTLPKKWFHRSIYKAHEPPNGTDREKSTQQESPEKNHDTQHAENEPGSIRSHPFGHRQMKSPSKPQGEQAHSCLNPYRQEEELATGKTGYQLAHPA